jgi:hypothetical protein
MAGGEIPSWTEEAEARPPAQNLSEMPDLVRFNISGQEPETLSLGGKDIPFLRHSPESSELWIRKEENWTQYAQVGLGQKIEMVAYTPTGGAADLYRISYARGVILHRGYELSPGYYRGSIRAAELGRTMLFLAVDNQPSNAVMVDVSPAVGAAVGPVNVESLPTGDAKVTVASDWLNGYDIYVDGVYRLNDWSDGLLDGSASFTVSGEKAHTITVSRGGNRHYRTEHTRNFKSGASYKLRI